MARLRSRAGTVVNVSDDTAARLRSRGWTDADSKRTETAKATPETAVADQPVCDECGFVAKTAGGLKAHQRRHEED
jgi:hypothetical protein